MELNSKKLQKFKLKRLLENVINLTNLYRQKNILTDEILPEDIDQLNNTINEFITKYCSE
jgi:hypothetical protein